MQDYNIDETPFSIVRELEILYNAYTYFITITMNPGTDGTATTQALAHAREVVEAPVVHHELPSPDEMRTLYRNMMRGVFTPEP